MTVFSPLKPDAHYVLFRCQLVVEKSLHTSTLSLGENDALADKDEESECCSAKEDDKSTTQIVE